jgi:NAD+-dependent protein deacetylase sirtuin 4
VAFIFQEKNLLTKIRLQCHRYESYANREFFFLRSTTMNLRSSQILAASTAVIAAPRRRKNQARAFVHLLGSVTFSLGERPPDPSSFLPESALHEESERLVSWWTGRENLLVLTGAGLSTESGIPDYRGNKGSYFTGHKPMLHDQFMKSGYQRQRYWGRGLAGWRYFDAREPAVGHKALAALERMGKLGVALEDRPDFYENPDEILFGSGNRQVSIVTQNVDGLHRKAGTRNLVELHGRVDHLVCTNCGATRDRRSYHEELEDLNHDWLREISASSSNPEYRADGDAAVSAPFERLQVPPCQKCTVGFVKPDVVFFGDNVPRHRVRLVEESINACDGLLVIGSSLAVHSANRHVRAASKRGVDIAILNVGETRAETEGLSVLKIEAPAGPVLERVVDALKQHQ